MSTLSQKICGNNTPNIDRISSLPTEVLYKIVSFLDHLKDRRALRNSNLFEFGALINKSITDDFSRDKEYILDTILRAAARRDERMIRRICEEGTGYVLKLNRYGWHGDWYIPEDGLKRPDYFALGQKPDDETVDIILSMGPNLVVGKSPYVCTDVENGTIKAYSMLSWALGRYSLKEIQEFMKMGADPESWVKLQLGEVNRITQTPFCVVNALDFLAPEEPRRTLYQGLANRHFHYNPIKDLDATYVWEGGYTLLHLAVVCSNSVKMVKALLTMDLDINAQNDNGESVLALAFNYQDTPPKVIKLLLEGGADTSLTPYNLMDAMLFEKHHHEKVAVFQKFMGNDYRGGDGRNYDGDTLLHNAVRCEMPNKHIKYLLERGLDVNIQNSVGETALSCAIQCAGMAHYKKSRMFKLLRSYGAEMIRFRSDMGCRRSFVSEPIKHKEHVNIDPSISERWSWNDGW